MGYIDQATKDRILSATSLLDVIGEDVELKKKGSNYKGCCPFHNDSNPSFYVSTVKEVWKCFSCGKGGHGAVSYLMEKEGMTYMEALRSLAKRAGIEVKERELSDEEKAECQTREEISAHINKCQEFFVEEFGKEENFELKMYAIKRWGEPFCREMGIGVCPARYKALQTYALQWQLNLETLVKAGMLSKDNEDEKKYHEPFYGRITIPIRDNMGNIVAYTARTIDPKEKNRKYTNNADTPVFKKGKILFGYNWAKQKASQQDKFYIVEGAPDAMRLFLLGVENGVATLGTKLTDDHLQLIKRIATRICFVPDSDPPKKNEEFGVGISTMMTNAIKAQEAGFVVFVREIPPSTNAKAELVKEDVDSFCKKQEDFEGLKEVDFPIWYAEKIFSRVDKESPESKVRAIKRVAAMLSTIKDQVRLEAMMPVMYKHERSKKAWAMALSEAREEDPRNVAKNERDTQHMIQENMHFFRKGNSYYSYNKDGDSVRWSNFALEPMYLIVDSTAPRRIYKLVNEDGWEGTIEMKIDELVSLAKFKQRVEGLGNFVWLASDKELTKLKLYLYANTMTANLIAKMGWQQAGFFAFGNGVLYNDEFYMPDDFGIINLGDLGNYYLPSSSKQNEIDESTYHFELSFVYERKQDVTLYQYFEKIVDVFGTNGMIAISFAVATFFRDIIFGVAHSFPILNLYGPKSTGKTELARALVSFFRTSYRAPNLANATASGLDDTVSNCVNAVVHIDEYQNEIDRLRIEFLKGLWDGTGRTRMSMDADKRQKTTPVTTGVILSGQQMPTADNALFSRVCFVDFCKSSFTTDEVRRYNDLKQVQDKGITYLTQAVLRHREHMEERYSTLFHEISDDVAREINNRGISINERVRKNWVTLLAAARCFSECMQLPFSQQALFVTVIERMIAQNKKVDGADEITRFWKIVGYLLADEKIFLDADIRIDLVDRLRRNDEQLWTHPHKVLKLNPDRVFELYINQVSKGTKEAALTATTLADYLQKTPQYLDRIKTRFDVFINKMPKIKQDTLPNGRLSTTKVTKSSNALIFDYDALVEKYDVDFEIDTYNDSE